VFALKVNLETKLAAIVAVSFVVTSVNILVLNQDAVLLWLDVYIQRLPDGNFYLHSDSLYPFLDIGVKIAGVTFSPDNQLLWYLVEARSAHVSKLANLSMVRKVSLAKAGSWDWWDINWRDKTRIDPLLEQAAQRVYREFPNEKILVIINHARIDSQAREQLIAFVKSVGGEIMRVGLAEYISAKLPPTSLNQIFENRNIRTLEAEAPICLN